MWLKALSVTGVVLTYIFACLLFISFVVTRDQNHNPLLGFLLGLILFRRISRLQSESVIINKQHINFFAYYIKALFIAFLKWLLYLTPVYIFAIIDAETASDASKNIGKFLSLYFCTIFFALDAPFWVWRKRKQFSDSGYPKKNMAWAIVGGIGLPLSLIYLFTFFIPVFQNSVQRAQSVAEASKFPKPRSIPAREPVSSPSDKENKSLQKNEDQLTEEEIDLLKVKAEQGDAPSQLRLGNCYLIGNGVVMDDVEALNWYHKAAIQGYAEAQVNLGVFYAMAGDDAKAVEWYRKAADQGVSKAQLNLGQCYEKGEGVPKDAVKAVNFYKKAALQGLAHAQYNLGVCYLAGNGVAKDEAEAVRWFWRASMQGVSEAQHNLGACFTKGEGIPKDYVEAYAFFSLAGENLGQSIRARSLLKKGMTSSQIEEGERRKIELRLQINNNESTN
jgi:tetratricopeptide (TPR) repeat protein